MHNFNKSLPGWKIDSALKEYYPLTIKKKTTLHGSLNFSTLAESPVFLARLVVHGGKRF